MHRGSTDNGRRNVRMAIQAWTSWWLPLSMAAIGVPFAIGFRTTAWFVVLIVFAVVPTTAMFLTRAVARRVAVQHPDLVPVSRH